MIEMLIGLIFGAMLMLIFCLMIHSWIEFGKKNDLVDTEYSEDSDEDESED